MDLREWNTLEEQALWLLGHADQASPREPLRGMALQLRLWRYGSHGSYVSWSVILPIRDYRAKRSMVREATWDRSSDWDRCMTPARQLKRRPIVGPEVRIRDAEMAWGDLSPFLESTAGIRSTHPRLTESALGAADRSGLEGSRSLSHVRLEWSGRGPREWATTIAWFERFRKILVAATREREVGPA